jgi:predicted Zn-ribbon and HTH transcriptional regulator
MGNKNLKDKAIEIKGKSYVLVADRVIYFNETYPNGCIQTEQLASEDRVEFKAVVIPDACKPERFFTGHSQAVWGDGYINKTSALENAETSAVGRALALMGIGVIESLASVDEINKATLMEKPQLMEIPPHCSICGKTANKVRWGWSCPDWKAHEERGEKPKMIQPPKQLDKNMQKFINSLPK